MSRPQPLVMDIGSEFSKLGFAGEDSPRTFFPTIEGHPKAPGIMVGMGGRHYFAGWEAQAKRGILKLRYAMMNWDASPFHWREWERVVRYGLGDDIEWGLDLLLDVPLSEKEKKQKPWMSLKDRRPLPEGQRVLVTEYPMISNADRMKKIELFFEGLQVSEYYAANSSVTSLYASGRTTGLVVGSGAQFTSAVAVYEGHALQKPTRQNKVAGRDVTHYLVRILAERGYEMTTSAEHEIVEKMKGVLCYVASDFEGELLSAEETGDCEHEYVLPDDSKMTIGGERFRAPEILFRPNFIGSECGGIHELAAETIKASDRDLQAVLRRTIVLSGGSTMFAGFEARLEKEISGVLPHGGDEVRIFAPVERKFSTWIGGSLLASSSLLDKCWITKKEFEDAGTSIVMRKCF